MSRPTSRFDQSGVILNWCLIASCRSPRVASPPSQYSSQRRISPSTSARSNRSYRSHLEDVPGRLTDRPECPVVVVAVDDPSVLVQDDPPGPGAGGDGVLDRGKSLRRGWGQDFPKRESRVVQVASLGEHSGPPHECRRWRRGRTLTGASKARAGNRVRSCCGTAPPGTWKAGRPASWPPGRRPVLWGSGIAGRSGVPEPSA